MVKEVQGAVLLLLQGRVLGVLGLRSLRGLGGGENWLPAIRALLGGECTCWRPLMGEGGQENGCREAIEILAKCHGAASSNTTVKISKEHTTNMGKLKFKLQRT